MDGESRVALAVGWGGKGGTCRRSCAREGKVVGFAEKPKGDALTAMTLDTTLLGVDEQT